MNRRAFISIIPAIALLGCASPGPEKPAPSGRRFSDAERNIITAYYKQQGQARTPSRSGSQVAIGDKLMSGERPNKLPTALDAQLPGLPEPYTRLVLGVDVILVNRDTHDILDVIHQIAQ